MQRALAFAMAALGLSLVPLHARAQETIYLVRHAEKAAGGALLDDAKLPLTLFGEKQAGLLADQLDDAGITAVYYSQSDPAFDPERKGESILRTKATACPLIKRLREQGKPVTAYDLVYPNWIGNWRDRAEVMVPFAEQAVETIRRNHRGRSDKAILIVGHENTVPAMIRQLAKTQLFLLDPETDISRPHEFMGPKEFGLLYEVNLKAATPKEFLRITRYAASSSTAAPATVLDPVERAGEK